MKRYLAVLLIFIFCLSACACDGNVQIDELAFVKIIGIDRTDDIFTVTAGIQLPTKGDNETKEETETISTECISFAEGMEKIKTLSSKKIFYGQISVVLLSEETAKNGMIDIVDYLVRSADMRFDIPVIITKGITAEKLITKSDNKNEFLSDKLEKMLVSAENTSKSGKVALSKLAEMLEDPFHSVYLPYITAEDIQKPKVEGYCIFNDDKLITFLDEELSTGVNYLNNTVKNRIFICKENSATVKVTKSKTKIKLKDGIFRINVESYLQILEAGENTENFDHTVTEEILKSQNDEVGKIINKTVDFLKENKCDAGGFGECFEKQNPEKAEEIKDNWGEMFSKIKFETVCVSELDKSKTSGKPVKQKGR